MSSRVAIVRDHDVALIRREREGATYYVFPGGGVEGDESFAAAAVREAYEELGVRVRLGTLLRVLEARDGEQRYYAAEVIDGTFGTGTGTEFSRRRGETRGRYTPVWVPIKEVSSLDLRPPELQLVLPALLPGASPSEHHGDHGSRA